MVVKTSLAGIFSKTIAWEGGEVVDSLYGSVEFFSNYVFIYYNFLENTFETSSNSMILPAQSNILMMYYLISNVYNFVKIFVVTLKFSNIL